MWWIEYLVASLVFILTCVVATLMIRAIKRCKEEEKLPIIKANATVQEKYTKELCMTQNDLPAYILDYYILFRFENNETRELYVSKAEYDIIEVGDYGELCTQGTRFISFERIKTFFN